MTYIGRAFEARIYMQKARNVGMRRYRLVKTAQHFAKFEKGFFITQPNANSIKGRPLSKSLGIKL